MHKELDIDNREKSSFRKSLLARPILIHKVRGKKGLGELVLGIVGIMSTNL